MRRLLSLVAGVLMGIGLMAVPAGAATTNIENPGFETTLARCSRTVTVAPNTKVRATVYQNRYHTTFAAGGAVDAAYRPGVKQVAVGANLYSANKFVNATGQIVTWAAYKSVKGEDATRPNGAPFLVQVHAVVIGSLWYDYTVSVQC